MDAPLPHRRVLRILAECNYLHRRVIHRPCNKSHTHTRVKHVCTPFMVNHPYFLRPRLRCSGNTSCHDCEVEILGEKNVEMYHVRAEIWTEAGLPDNEFLCIACLELRLQRQLTRADFSEFPVNIKPAPHTSQRLLDRLGVKQEDGHEYWKNCHIAQPALETFEHNKV